MKNSVFVKVRVEDELPNVADIYYTDNGVKWYSTLEHQFTDQGGKAKIEWWLKEVEIPSDQELYTLSSRCATTEKMNGFEEGANYILSKLK